MKISTQGRLVKVNISDLVINERNPRHIPAKNEHEAILRIVQDQDEKLFNLATDIAINGLNPTEKITAFKIENQSNYKVIEGNRRVTCLKILTDPEICLIVKEHSERLYNKFNKFITALKERVNEQVEIYTHDDENYLYFLMENRHLGENGGRGLTPWDSIQKGRYKQRKGEKTPLITFLDMIVNEGYVSRKDAFGGVNLTNWERILGLIGQKQLSIALQDNKYHILDKDNFSKKIELVVDALRNQPVKIVYDNEAIEEFFKTINNRLGVPKEPIKVSSNNLLIKMLDKPTLTSKIEIDNKNESLEDKPIQKKMHLNRNTKISENKYSTLKCTKIPENEFRILYLYKEIKSLSKSEDYKKYPLATLFIARALFEQCIKYYCDKQPKPINTIDNNGRDISLSNLIKTILKPNPFEFFGDSQLDRTFKTTFTTDSTSKDILDIFMHHPKYFSGNYNEILPVINGIIFNVINHVLNN